MTLDMSVLCSGEITQDKLMLEERWKKVKTINGTQKFHSVFSKPDGTLMVSDVERVVFFHFITIKNNITIFIVQCWSVGYR